MLSVDEARLRILDSLKPLGGESVALTAALGRVLAEDLTARLTQPPVAMSAMDGYALRAADAAKVPARLTVVGEAPAGGAFAGTVQAGQAVRIFTGGPLPAGADTVVIQEDTDRNGDQVTVKEAAKPGGNIRDAGIDFKTGQTLLKRGRVLTARDIALAAAANHPWLTVGRQPRIAILATGDELVKPGDALGPHQIISSNGPGLAAFVRACGGEPVDLGIAPDDADALRAMAAHATGVDLLVTIGGASVGDRDLVQKVLGEVGLTVDFWKIAMKPGKPLMFGAFNGIPMVGLPGNPVSALVCAILYLRPAILALQGATDTAIPMARAKLGRAIKANNFREDFLRATLAEDAQGEPVATPLPVQDSSMLSALAGADCLIRRPPNAAARSAGEWVPIVPLSGGTIGI
jgi:molybdopterin molybdotransferase